jgi:hypothetical protein
MTIPRRGVHTASELRRSTRRLDRCLAGVDQILDAMRTGEALHLQYKNNSPLWSLSGGRIVAARVATLVTANAFVVPVDGSLFSDLPGQTWRYLRLTSPPRMRKRLPL